MTCHSNDNIVNSLFHALPFGVYIIDVHSWKVLFTNRHMKEILGLDIREGGLCYREIFNIIASGTLKACLMRVNRLISLRFYLYSCWRSHEFRSNRLFNCFCKNSFNS
ncbi:MAG: PAS domain-containing protein [Thermodesulfobacteriota bacterium]